MKKLFMIFGLFLLCGTGFSYQEVIERLPGYDTRETSATVKSTVTWTTQSVSPSAVSLVTSSVTLPGFIMGGTFIQNKDATNSIYYGFDTTVTTTGATEGIEIKPGQSVILSFHKEIFIYLIAKTAAVNATVVHYGHK